jgi:hypothetical protein
MYTGHFAKCHTRQRGALHSVRDITLGKETIYRALSKEPDKGTRWWILCRVQVRRHSAKPPLLLGAVTAVFFAEYRLALGKCRIPSGTRQRSLCRCTVRRALFAECDTRQSARFR